MKREAFSGAAESAVRAIDDRYLLVARGMLYGLGAPPLYVGVFKGEDNRSYRLAAASTSPDDDRLDVIDVRHDVHTANGFQGATNAQKAPNPQTGELEDVSLLVPKNTNVFVPNDAEQDIMIGRRALATVAFEDN